MLNLLLFYIIFSYMSTISISIDSLTLVYKDDIGGMIFDINDNINKLKFLL